MAMFLLSLCVDITIPQTMPHSMFVDSQSAMFIALNPVTSSRTRHINIRYHFVREMVKEGTILLVYVPTSENIADIFTKPLSRILFQKFRAILHGHK